MKNKIFATLLALTLALSLTACGSKSDDSAKADTTDDAQTEQPAEPQETVTLNVAASPTPHAEILKQCVPILAEQGIDLQIHEYSDYVVPNTAVEDGDEDANYFQHVPYLDDFNTTRGTHLVSVTGVHIEPMGIYAGKSDSLDNLPDGASVAVPNDATNEGRALLLLEAQGLIKLADDSNLSSTPKDIVENPKNLTFTEVEAATIPSIASEVDLAVINSNYALGAGLNPVEDALALESSDSPYVNVLVCKEGNENNAAIQALAEALHSDAVKNTSPKTLTVPSSPLTKSSSLYHEDLRLCRGSSAYYAFFAALLRQKVQSPPSEKGVFAREIFAGFLPIFNTNHRMRATRLEPASRHPANCVPQFAGTLPHL